MSRNTHYWIKNAAPMIVEILKKEGFNITPDNIKCWQRDIMSMEDVLRGCNYVKRELNSNVICYTNELPQH